MTKIRYGSVAAAQFLLGPPLIIVIIIAFATKFVYLACEALIDWTLDTFDLEEKR